MTSILIDAGPLIALFNRKDQYHGLTLDYLKSFRGQLLSTWPVMTEVTHMLDFSVQQQLNFLRWAARGALSLLPLEAEHLQQMIALTEKYQNVPMDLADSSLVVMAESLNIRQIATFDSDYYIYRIGKKGFFENVLKPEGK